MIDLSPRAEQRLRESIEHFNWNSRHTLDENRFYGFVRALCESDRNSFVRSRCGYRVSPEVKISGKNRDLTARFSCRNDRRVSD
jgi:hypothetical protein